MKRILLILFLFFLYFQLLLSSKNIPHVDVYLIKSFENVPLTFKYPARVKSINRVTVFARVSGILQKRYFKEGDFVKKNQILFKIEPDIYIAKYRLALANLEVAKANFRKTLRDWKRIKALYAKKATSKKNYDKALSDYEIAIANVKKAKAQVKLARINLGYTKVKSPISGYTRLKITDIGNLVSYGTPLIEILKIQPIYVEFSIPDKDYFKIMNCEHDNLNVKIVLNGKEINENGKINYIDKEIDKNTSTVKIRAEFPNKLKLLLPGEFVRVKLSGIFLKNAITIPQKAIIQKGQYSIVFIVDKNNIVRVRPIYVYGTIKDKSIVLKGLFPGEKVVINNFFRISPNSPVKIDKIIK